MIKTITSKLACMGLLLLASASALAQPTQKRLALLIGNSAYQNIAPLSSPSKDVDAMESLLVSAGFEVMKVKDATRRAIKENINTFTERLKDYDVGMFYYSGHGLEVDGINYIVPIDLSKLSSNTNKLDIDEECIKTNYINGKMGAAGAVNKTYILVLDACRNSPFKGFKDIGENDGWEQPRDVPAGSIVCYAASGGQKAADGSTGQNSPYTTCFIKHAQVKDRKIEDVFKKVRIELTGTEAQVPQEVSSLNTDFYFFKGSTAPVVPAPTSQDRDGDGVKDADDGCPDVFGTERGCPVGVGSTEGDYDGDGIKDKDDACPQDYGTANGCPDADDDRVPDKSDQCKYVKGEPRWQGCPDTDSDGIPDHQDTCPSEYGQATDNGCPLADSDKDGVPDKSDRCATAYGLKQYQGCPDTDSDGIPDHQDGCPSEYGQATDNGCPLADSDKDGVPDKSDRCATAYGLKQYQGCPDTDGDGIPDIEDDCPQEKGLATKKGCPLPVAAPSKVSGTYTEKCIKPSFKMVAIPAGTFTMGCTSDPRYCDDTEIPAHQVTLSSFYIGETEVTQAQWYAVMGTNPSWFNDCDECPVEMINRSDVQAFLSKLNTISVHKYRLPTEAEWEYAAKGGQDYSYSGSDNIDEVAWHGLNSMNKSHVVKGKMHNGYGLYDMSGGIYELCSDIYKAYSSNSQTNPTGPTVGTLYVARGGSWYDQKSNCLVADRQDIPDFKVNFLGFRLVASQ